MKQNFKKWLAALLALCLLSILAPAALAEADATPENVEASVEELTFELVGDESPTSDAPPEPEEVSTEASSFDLIDINAPEAPFTEGEAPNDGEREDRWLMIRLLDGHSPAKVYDMTTNAALAPSDFEIEGVAAGDTVTISRLSAAYDSAEVGTHSVTIYFDIAQDSATYNYRLTEVSLTVEGEITPRDIADSDIDMDPISLAVYTGYPHTPMCALRFGDSLLSEGTDYTLSYADNTAVGTAFVTITGLGNYTGSRQETFRIVDGSGKTDRMATVKLKAGRALTKVYDGTGRTGLSVADFELENVAEGDTVSFNLLSASYDSINAGSCRVSARFRITEQSSALYNYQLAEPVLVMDGVITPKPVVITPESGQSQYYGESRDSYAWTTSGLLSEDSITGGLGREPGDDAGMYRFTLGTLDAGGNYALEVAEAYYVIQPCVFSHIAIFCEFEQDTWTYTGSAIEPEATVTCDLFGRDYTLTKGVDYDMAYYDNVETGQARAVFTGKGNFTGANTVSFRIVEAEKTDRVVTIRLKEGHNPYKVYDATRNCVYGDNARGLRASDFEIDNVADGDTVRITSLAGGYESLNASDEALVSVTFTIDSDSRQYNYILSESTITVTGKISKKVATVTPKEGQSKLWGTDDPRLNASVRGIYSTDKGKIIGALSREPGEDPGRYEITLGTLSFGPNYTIDFVTGVYFTIEPVSLAIQPSTVGPIGLKDTVQLTAVGSALTKLKWSTSDKKVATVSGKGKVTGKGAGTATITVKNGSGDSAAIDITVRDIHAPTSVTITPAEPGPLALKQTVRLTADMESESGAVKTRLKWTTSDKKIATVSGKGVVKGKAAGTVTITVTTANGLSDSVDIVVKDVNAPTSLRLDPEGPLSIAPREKVTITPKMESESGTVKTKLKWTTSDKKVATVTGKGVVTGKKPGRATITVTTANGLKATVVVNVK